MTGDNFMRAAQVLSIYDGDTFTAMVDLGYSQWCKTNIRMLGLDTPEMRKYKGRQEKPWGTLSRKHLVGLIKQNPKGKLGRKLWIRSVKPDKFGGRYLGEAFFWDDPEGTTINQMMIDDKFARPYDGTKKTLYPLDSLPIQPESD